MLNYCTVGMINCIISTAHFSWNTYYNNENIEIDNCKALPSRTATQTRVIKKIVIGKTVTTSLIWNAIDTITNTLNDKNPNISNI